MAERRFYWLKLPEEFFRDKRIKKLRRIAGGDTFTLIYLKMLLASMQTEGKLYFDGLEQFPAEEIALDLDEDPENVSMTINFLVTVGLAEVGQDEVTLTDLNDMVGSESSAAIRKRRSRSGQIEISSDAIGRIEDKRDIVTPVSRPCHDESQNVTQSKSKRREEKDIEREVECNKRTPHVTLGNQIIYEDEYEQMVKRIGKQWVDRTISRIVDTPYKNCLTVNKILQWSLEDKNKQSRSNKFNNYEQRDIDYDALV